MLCLKKKGGLEKYVFGKHCAHIQQRRMLLKLELRTKDPVNGYSERVSYLNSKGLNTEAKVGHNMWAEHEFVCLKSVSFSFMCCSTWSIKIGCGGRKVTSYRNILNWTFFFSSTFFSVISSFTTVAFQARCSFIRGAPVREQGLQCLPRYLYREGGPADGA